MAKRKVKVGNPNGLHARVALSIAEKVKSIPGGVIICRDGKQADASSILDLLLLGAAQGSEVEIIVSGEDEEKHLHEIAQIFSDGGGI